MTKIIIGFNKMVNSPDGGLWKTFALFNFNRISCETFEIRENDLTYQLIFTNEIENA